MFLNIKLNWLTSYIKLIGFCILILTSIFYLQIQWFIGTA